MADEDIGKERGWCFYRGWRTMANLDQVEGALERLAVEVGLHPEERSEEVPQAEVERKTAKLAMRYAIDQITSGRRPNEDSCVGLTSDILEPLRQEFFEQLDRNQVIDASKTLAEMRNQVLVGLQEKTGHSFGLQ